MLYESLQYTRGTMTHFLQSTHWQQFQEALGRKAFTDNDQEWSYRAYREHGAANTRLYAPYGPTFTSIEAFDHALTSLTNQAKAQNATFLRIEPTSGISPDELRRRGFRPVTYQQLNPARTQIIDLSPSSDELLARMSQNSRNLTRNYTNKGISIHTSTDPSDITILTSLLHQVAKRNHITPHSDSYFQTQSDTLFPAGAAKLFYATYEGKPIAAALVYDSDDTRYYAHAAADDTYRKLSAGAALVGYMILDAKQAGLAYFDLYGIAPENHPNHPWVGFTKFKQSFGGQPVDYLGAWDLPLNPLPYYTYRLYQALRRKLRR